MSPAKKKTTRAAKATGRKKAGSKTKSTTRKTASKTSAKKATSKKKTAAKTTAKATAKKTPVKKKAAAPAPKAAPKRTARQAPALKSTAKARAKAEARAAPPVPDAPQPEGVGRLGVKYVCFECGAKFYDLNRPEPICPKCGADQRKRPKKEKKASGPAQDRAGRAMAPLLQEEAAAEEEPAIAIDDEGLEIGLGVVDEEDDDDDEEEET